VIGVCHVVAPLSPDLSALALRQEKRRRWLGSEQRRCPAMTFDDARPSVVRIPADVWDGVVSPRAWTHAEALVPLRCEAGDGVALPPGERFELAVPPEEVEALMSVLSRVFAFAAGWREAAQASVAPALPLKGRPVQVVIERDGLQLEEVELGVMRD